MLLRRYSEMCCSCFSKCCATYKLVKDYFGCESHGIMNVKGKGEMEVWFVTGQRDKLV